MITQLLLVATGGALGSMTRFLVLSSTTALLGDNFPFGTLIVNIVGSFFAGILVVLITDKNFFSIDAQSLLMVGFLGAMTTFSTFSVETIHLIQSADWTKAISNIFLNITLSLLGAFLGIFLAKGQ